MASSYVANLRTKSNLLRQCSSFCRTLKNHLYTESRILESNPPSTQPTFANKICPLSVGGVKLFARTGLGSERFVNRSFRVSSGRGAGITGGSGSSDGGWSGSSGGGWPRSSGGGWPRSLGGGGSGSSDGGGSGSSGGGGSGGGGAGEGSGNWLVLSWYLSLLAKHPVTTKAITSAFLTLVGDLVCQLGIDQVQSLDMKRTFLFTLLGLVMVGPTLHFWYLYLSKLVKTAGASGAFWRLILDQFVFAPIFIGSFLSILVTLEGRPSDVIPKLKQEWFSSVLANWQLWIPFQYLNFRFVPQPFQVLAANLISLVWNVILSYKAHKEVIIK